MAEYPSNKDLLRRLIDVEEKLAVVSRRLERWESKAQPAADTRKDGASGSDPIPSLPPPIPRRVESPPRVSDADLDREKMIPNKKDAMAAASSFQVGPPTPDEVSRPPRLDLRERLARCGFLPPRGEGTLEIQVGTWWTTRIGAVLAVITGAFFAVYVSKNVPPWVRFGELLGGSVGVTLLGLWLERRYRRFGEVLFGSGLALIYFSVYAGYAVSPVKVMDNAILATLLQYAAAVGLFLCARWRASVGIATMATFLGYVACLFSSLHGLPTYALVAAATLAIGALCFYLIRRWQRPLLVSVPLTYVIYGVVMTNDPRPSYALCFAYLLFYVMIFGAADYLALLKNAVMPRLQRRGVQILNTSAAAVLGYLMTAQFYPEYLTTFYAILGGLFTGTALLYYLTKHSDVMMHTYFVKGSALITLAMMTAFESRTRWAALAVESLVLLMSAKRSRLKVVEGAMALVWCASFYFFLQHLYGLGRFSSAYPILSGQGGSAVFYLALTTILFCLQGRWLGAAPDDDEETPTPSAASIAGRQTFRVQLNLLYSLFLGLLGLGVSKAFGPATYFPLAAALMGVLTVLIGIAFRHWIAYVGGSIPFLIAHIVFWTGEHATRHAQPAWMNGAVLIGLSLGAAVLICYCVRTDLSRSWRIDPAVLDAVLHGLWITTWYCVIKKTCGFESSLLIMVVTSCLVAGATLKFPFLHLGDFSSLPMALWLVDAGRTFFGGSDPMVHTGSTLFLCLGAVGAYGYACAHAMVEPLRSRLVLLRPQDQYQVLHTLLAWLIGLVALQTIFHDRALMLSLGIAGVTCGLLCRWSGLKPTFYAGLCYLLAAHCICGLLMPTQGRAGDTLFLAMVLLLAALTLAYAVCGRYLRGDLAESKHELLQFLLGSLALLMMFLLFYLKPGDWHSYVTVLWGASAVMVLTVGLLLSVRPLRILGLIGLALCIPRVFIVDVRSTLHRIIAFGVLSAVLLVVGFVYNKYHEVIQQTNGSRPGAREQ
ncbi:MAG: DUF2339 domain-containing protein [Planctomycetes bacterium]|nr:DUF2339 domain-containing protein [Planctomycetota bacterium]